MTTVLTKTALTTTALTKTALTTTALTTALKTALKAGQGPSDYRATGHSAGARRRLMAMAVAAVVVIGAFLGAAQFIADQKLRDDCSRFAGYEGFRGAGADVAMDFCVDFAKRYLSGGGVSGGGVSGGGAVHDGLPVAARTR